MIESDPMKPYNFLYLPLVILFKIFILETSYYNNLEIRLTEFQLFEKFT